jgi:hypothetical protein
MRYAAIKSPANDCTAGFEDIDSAEVLPQSERYRRQDDPRSSAAVICRFVVSFFIRYVGHFYSFSVLSDALAFCAWAWEKPIDVIPKVITKVDDDLFGCAANYDPLERDVS